MYRIQSINNPVRNTNFSLIENSFFFSKTHLCFWSVLLSSIQVINPWELISSGIGIVNYF